MTIETRVATQVACVGAKCGAPCALGRSAQAQQRACPLKFWISAEFFDFQVDSSPGLRGPIERALEGGLGLAQMWRPLCSKGTRGRTSCTSHIDFLEQDSAFGL